MSTPLEAPRHTPSDDPSGEVVSLGERLVVSPCEGKLRVAPPRNYTAEGEYVMQGQVVGGVETPNGEVVPVTSPFSGWVMGFLTKDGMPVRASEPILWLRRL